ncbi:hypothetical protein, partial [Clostridium sp. HCS.1]|uniref:hypothetical protein n=1 Tax=Clostridium sp. HCS.1 TaxID=3238594 RepID=UPI003A0FE6A8
MYNNWYKKTEEKIKNLKLEIETLKNEKEKFADNINKINNGIDLLSSSKEYNVYLTLDKKYNSFKDELNEKSQKILKTGIKELNLEIEFLKK